MFGTLKHLAKTFRAPPPPSANSSTSPQPTVMISRLALAMRRVASAASRPSAADAPQVSELRPTTPADVERSISLTGSGALPYSGDGRQRLPLAAILASMVSETAIRGTSRKWVSASAVPSMRPTIARASQRPAARKSSCAVSMAGRNLRNRSDDP